MLLKVPSLCIYSENKLGTNHQKFWTHGHEQQCGDCWGEEGIRGLKGNGKLQQILIKIQKKKMK